LLHIPVKVLGILIQHQATELLHRGLRTGPDLGDVERIESELVRIGFIWL
jgi:hypothetical protein